ncbi:glycosyltransferase family 2 protein [Sulfurovum sp.]|uniref:glycosyltransferase family 2 protein n=1 Tax=Sulfurovum sp. TaxID=1969726 RepID=UPI0035652CB9
MSHPMISVVMPVYNGEKHLNEAIESILNQTYTDFEFIIINDGSTDKTEDIILSYKDPRILYSKNEINLQIVKTLNKALDMASGKYIARMDADDISLPRRFEKQVDFMEANRHISVCGSFIKTIGGDVQHSWTYPITPEAIKIALMFFSPLAHPTVMARKTFFDHARYNIEYQKAEDYYLWASNKNSKFANIAEVLLFYRLHKSQTGQISGVEQLALSDKIRKQLLEGYGIPISDKEFEIHKKISCYQYVDMYDAEEWLYKLFSYNKTNHIFDESSLIEFLDEKWWMIINNSTFRGLRAMECHRSSKVNFISKSLLQNIKLFIKCILKYKTAVNRDV